MNNVCIICILLCSLLLVALISFIVLFVKAKKALKEANLDKQALLLIFGTDKIKLIKEVEKIDDLYTELATTEVEITADVRIIERARKLLIEAIQK